MFIDSVIKHLTTRLRLIYLFAKLSAHYLPNLKEVENGM